MSGSLEIVRTEAEVFVTSQSGTEDEAHNKDGDHFLWPNCEHPAFSNVLFLPFSPIKLFQGEF